MSDTAPLVNVKQVRVPAAATAVDSEVDVAEAPFGGTVSAVRYVPDTVLTGVDTNSRTLVLVNKGQSGAGAVVVATKAFTNGVNGAADDAATITLSAVAGATTVVQGDVLAWQSTHVGTGLADPGGLVEVELTRS